MRCVNKKPTKELIIQELKKYIQEKDGYNSCFDRWSYSMHVSQKLGYKHWIVQGYLKEIEKDKDFIEWYEY